MNREENEIYLIGFMGVGKSTVGEAFAQKHHMIFIDTDRLIEQKYGKSVATIFETESQQMFRWYEAKMLRSTAGYGKKLVSCGGGLPLFWQNMQWINNRGTSFFLNASAELIFHRLSVENSSSRPLLPENKHQFSVGWIDKMLRKRSAWYQMADFSLDASLPVEKIIEKMENILNNL